MPVPKRRHSSTRRDKRRTHDKLSSPAVSKCSHCGQPKVSHRVCTNCGYYGKKMVIEAEESKG